MWATPKSAGDTPAAPVHPVPGVDDSSSPGVVDPVRLERAARESFQFIWRCLRRFGVRPDHAVDDAAQRVFEIAARKRHLIAPGHERAFLFRTAVFVAAETRRGVARQKEVVDDGKARAEIDPASGPDGLLDRRRWRAVLDALLENLPLELRTVFVLYELEGINMAEIAGLLELPPGTVASRLRRARDEFHTQARRLRARFDNLGGEP
jgi:RNA polymerase sigma-70 factor, ECF subfamily